MYTRSNRTRPRGQRSATLSPRRPKRQKSKRRDNRSRSKGRKKCCCHNHTCVSDLNPHPILKQIPKKYWQDEQYKDGLRLIVKRILNCDDEIASEYLDVSSNKFKSFKVDIVHFLPAYLTPWLVDEGESLRLIPDWTNHGSQIIQHHKGPSISILQE